MLLPKRLLAGAGWTCSTKCGPSVHATHGMHSTARSPARAGPAAPAPSCCTPASPGAGPAGSSGKQRVCYCCQGPAKCPATRLRSIPAALPAPHPPPPTCCTQGCRVQHPHAPASALNWPGSPPALHIPTRRPPAAPRGAGISVQWSAAAPGWPPGSAGCCGQGGQDGRRWVAVACTAQDLLQRPTCRQLLAGRGGTEWANVHTRSRALKQPQQRPDVSHELFPSLAPFPHNHICRQSRKETHRSRHSGEMAGLSGNT